MERIAPRKVHFAPYARQMRAIAGMIRRNEARNVTEVMRNALDHFLAARGHPTLAEQARQMAEDFHQSGADSSDPAASAQDTSRGTDEEW